MNYKFNIHPTKFNRVLQIPILQKIQIFVRQYTGVVWMGCASVIYVFWMLLNGYFKANELSEFLIVIGLFYLLNHSRSLKSKYADLLWIGITIYSVGQLFSFFNWSLFSEIMLFGIVFMLIGYSRFLNSLEAKTPMDYYKLCWLVLNLLSAVWISLALKPYSFLTIFVQLSFWPIYFVYSFHEMKKKQLEEKAGISLTGIH